MAQRRGILKVNHVLTRAWDARTAIEHPSGLHRKVMEKQCSGMQKCILSERPIRKQQREPCSQGFGTRFLVKKWGCRLGENCYCLFDLDLSVLCLDPIKKAGTRFSFPPCWLKGTDLKPENPSIAGGCLQENSLKRKSRTGTKWEKIWGRNEMIQAMKFRMVLQSLSTSVNPLISFQGGSFHKQKAQAWVEGQRESL